ncbi:hypothetical protein ACHAW6_005700 [Cyclotella cf. meneghiniana]
MNTDLTGRFPTMSLENKQYIFVAYNYTTNAIIVRAITDRESTAIVKAFDNIFSYLEHKGFKPKFNVLDNEASAAITKYLLDEDIKWQFVSPNKHRVNATKRAIQTFKIYFISGLCSTDHNFPAQLWDKLLSQAQDSLNMLQTSRNDPTKSANEILEGPHNFNCHTWAPPGCHSIIHKLADNRTLWGHVAPMLGTSGQPNIITEATSSTCLKLEHTKSPHPLDFSPVTTISCRKHQ